MEIQSLFVRIHQQAPPEKEIIAYAERLNHIVRFGGRIAAVQVYTVARPPAQEYVTGLSNEEVELIADTVRRLTDLTVRSFYG